MARLTACVILTATGLVFASDACAQSEEYKRAQIVNARRPLMSELQTAYWVLFDVQEGESSDLVAAGEAAERMIGLIADFATLMEPGTAKGEAPGSRATPEVWTDPQGFSEAVHNLQEAAAAMAGTARSGDAEGFGPAFLALTSACTACHGLRPSSGGRYRHAFE